MTQCENYSNCDYSIRESFKLFKNDLSNGKAHIYWGYCINKIINEYDNLYWSIHKSNLPKHSYTKFSKLWYNIFKNNNTISTTLKFASESILHSLYTLDINYISDIHLNDIWVIHDKYDIKLDDNLEYQIINMLTDSRVILNEYKNIVCSYKSIHSPRLIKALNKWIKLIDKY